MRKKSGPPALIQVGQIPLFKTLVKELCVPPPTPALTRPTGKLLEAAVAIQQEPDAFELAYMARELVQCTLPHSNPGDLPVWTQTNGNITLAFLRR